MNRLIILQENMEFTRKIWNYVITKEKKLYLSSLAVSPKEATNTINSVGEGDIVILDFEIKEIDAFELLKKLKRTKKPLPYIIAISGKSKVLARLRKYDTYFFEVIEKPFPFGKIIGTIERIIARTIPKTKEELIKIELHRFDMNVITKGYQYIVEAVLLSLEDKTLLKDMRHGLYKVMAEKREEIDENNVKWTLEKSVRSIKRYTKESIIKAYFYVANVDEVTPKRFISTIAEKVQIKLEQTGS